MAEPRETSHLPEGLILPSETDAASGKSSVRSSHNFFEFMMHKLQSSPGVADDASTSLHPVQKTGQTGNAPLARATLNSNNNNKPRSCGAVLHQRKRGPTPMFPHHGSEMYGDLAPQHPRCSTFNAFVPFMPDSTCRLGSVRNDLFINYLKSEIHEKESLYISNQTSFLMTDICLFRSQLFAQFPRLEITLTNNNDK